MSPGGLDVVPHTSNDRHRHTDHRGCQRIHGPGKGSGNGGLAPFRRHCDSRGVEGDWPRQAGTTKPVSSEESAVLIVLASIAAGYIVRTANGNNGTTCRG